MRVAIVNLSSLRDSQGRSCWSVPYLLGKTTTEIEDENKSAERGLKAARTRLSNVEQKELEAYRELQRRIAAGEVHIVHGMPPVPDSLLEPASSG